jgi:acyl-CoA reductase-like NAD-dependent aldehyde dehydrogenase
MANHKMWIGGKWVEAESGKLYDILNPATEEKIGSVPLGDQGDVEKAVVAAKTAFPLWSAKPQDERYQILLDIAASVKANLSELIPMEVMEHGTPVGMANGMFAGITGSMEWIPQACRTLWGDYIPTSQNARFYLKREPIGVCGLIIPWNGPLAVAIGMSIPALAMGNTCIIKPPSVNALTVLKYGEILEKHNLPPGTVNIVTGPGSTVGEAIASHPGVGMVSFTGSCEVGKRIMELGSKTVKRLNLELGGKNPFIVLEDADIDMAAGKAAMAQLWNTGQICASPGRYYVHEKVHDEFVKKYIENASKWTVGDPSDEKTMMGPVVSAAHRDHVEYYIKKGIEEGAKLVMGGKRPTEPPLDKGYFIMPTVFTGVTQNMTIAREEIFGPVACIIKYSDKDNVIEMANDTTFGLCASVWTTNIPKGIKYADAIVAGSVWINDHLVMGNELPWGGFKESGIGKDHHILGLEAYAQHKLVSFNMAQADN